MKITIEKLLVLLLSLLFVAGIVPVSVMAAATPSVSYCTHVQNEGWQNYVINGDMSGTSGKSLRLEGIKIKLDTQGYDLGISYQTHIQNIGWEAETTKGWKSNNAVSGTEGLSYRLEAIQIKLTGADSDKFDIYYQVHAQNIGWMGWAKNGESAGTAGYGWRLEGIRIEIVPTGSAAPGSTDNAFLENQLAPYDQILAEYRLLETTQKYDKNTMPDVNSEFSWMTHPMYNIDVKIYYLFEDLSGDSVPELILINHEAIGTDYLIVDTYQLINGKPEKLIDDYSLGCV